MRPTVFFLFVLFPLCAFAQKTTYFENLDFHEEVSKKKAKYKKVVFLDLDTTIVHTIQLEGEVLRKVSKKRNGQPSGIWKTFDEKGVLTSTRNFEKLVYNKPPIPLPWETNDPLANEKKFEEARFPGGDEAWAEFLEKELHFPKEMFKSKEIRILVFIGREGHLLPYTIPRKQDMLLEMEAWELVRKMPPWIPATKDGTPVASFLMVTIKFESPFEIGSRY